LVFPNKSQYLRAFASGLRLSSLRPLPVSFGGFLRHQKAPKGTHEKDAMKITKVKHHGQTRYRVNDPHGEGGSHVRCY